MKLEEFKLSYRNDTICSVTDGASKMGRISPCGHQKCFAHGIHLALFDVLYKSKPSMCTHELSENCSDGNYEDDNLEKKSLTDGNVEIDMDDTSTLQDLRDDYEINVTVQRVRKIVKFFRKSPQKNQILQVHGKCEFNKEIILILDTRTSRWNSLVNIIERFLKLKKCIEKAMVNLGDNIS